MSVKVVADWVRRRREDVAVKWGAEVCSSVVPGVHWPGSWVVCVVTGVDYDTLLAEWCP